MLCTVILGYLIVWLIILYYTILYHITCDCTIHRYWWNSRFLPESTFSSDWFICDQIFGQGFDQGLGEGQKPFI